MRKIFSSLVLAAVAAFVSAGQANAGVITSLYNTGVNGAGVSLPDSTLGDPHYSLVSVPGGTSDLLVRTSAGGYPIPPYFGDSPRSAWIGPNNDHQVDGPVGLYDYQTTFNLTGFNPLTASIKGGWSSDNDGVKILLNGVDTGNPATNFAQFSIGFAPFSISGGFKSGWNTLDFIVNNGGGPTALRVDMLGTARAVPEPSSFALLGLGGISLAVGAYRRRRATAV